MWGAQEKSEGAHQKNFGRHRRHWAPSLANCFGRHWMSKLGYSVSYDEVYVLSSALHSVATMKTPCKVSQSFSHSGLLIMLTTM